MSKPEKKKIDPAYFIIREYEKGYCLALGDEPLKFKNGEIAVHEQKKFWEHVIEEFKGHGSIEIDEDTCYLEPNEICAFKLLETQKLSIESEDCEFVKNFKDCIACDNIIRRCAGREVLDQLARWGPAIKFLGENQITLPDHPQVPIESSDANDVFTTKEDKEFVEFVSMQFDQLSNAQKSVVFALFNIYKYPVVFPILLAKGICTTSEFANGVMASECMLNSFGDIEDEDHSVIYKDLRGDAQISLNFIQSNQPSFISEIDKGENEHTEFKSTLRVCLKENQNKGYITDACMKTIAGFMNSEGGTLFIGVGDEGNIIGIEADKFQNQDKFLLFLKDKIGNEIGKEYSPYWKTQIHKYEGKTICEVIIKKSEKPAYLGKSGDFFIRHGPSSEKLSNEQTVDYIKYNFPNY